MSLDSLEVFNVRCLEHALLELDPYCNVVLGNNGAGKTTLLEAVSLLGTGRSFRTHRLQHMVRHGAMELVVTGVLSDEDVRHRVGFRASEDGREAKLDGERLKAVSQLALLLPVQVIEPEVHELIQGGPARRRQFLDWGVFHVEQHAYLYSWQRYRKALSQRNASLASGRLPDPSWDLILVEHGSRMHEARQKYVDGLKYYVAASGRLLLADDVDVILNQGWSKDMDLGAALKVRATRDQALGATSVGPHRAELGIKVGGMEARSDISRGQQKLLAATLLIAQLLHYQSLGLRLGCLLIDDLAAELDEPAVERLLATVAQIPVQLIVTSLDPQFSRKLPAGRAFHVEHGVVHGVA